MTGSNPIDRTQPVTGHLKRELDTVDAVMLGLGSILGTGIFVSVGVAAGIAGPSVLIAIALAACVAACNALSAAQLAAAHPVSGGTYEYGYQYLNPVAGFTAGWMFLLAKAASAATAALGFAGYTHLIGGTFRLSIKVIACATIAVLTVFILAGIRRTSRLNAVVVSVTLLALFTFVVTAFWYQMHTDSWANHFAPFFRGHGFFHSSSNVFHATALMFVAYAGYARITTLAEEVKDPRRTIPKAIMGTLVMTAIIYMAVALAGIGSTGADFLAGSTKTQAAPLSVAAEGFGVPLAPGIVAIGAATAMLGVLLNLILGLSRVLLAMGRRGDMPRGLTRVDTVAGTPWVAVICTGVAITGLALIGSVQSTWSFSAFTVLIYYAITNAAALAIPPEQRLYPRWIAVTGLISCLLLAFQLDRETWLVGLAVVGAGILWYYAAQTIRRFRSDSQRVSGNGP